MRGNAGQRRRINWPQQLVDAWRLWCFQRGLTR